MVYSSLRALYTEVQVLTEQPIYYYNLHIPFAEHRYAIVMYKARQELHVM